MFSKLYEFISVCTSIQYDLQDFKPLKMGYNVIEETTTTYITLYVVLKKHFFRIFYEF